MVKKNEKCLVSVIFVYFNTPLEIVNAISSIKNSIKDYTYEVIIVDNCSQMKLPEKIRMMPRVRIINNKKNNGYGKAMNQGAEIATGKYLLLSNPDVLFLKDAIALMVKKLDNDLSIGIVGPQFLDIKHEIQMVGSGMPLLPGAFFAFSFLNKLFPTNYFSKQYFLLDFDRKSEKKIPVLCGACLMIRKNVFKEIKGFDERFFMYFEEADICYRVRNIGRKVIYYPSAKVIHLVGKSSNDKSYIRKNFEESRYKFFIKYHNGAVAAAGEGLLRFLSFPGKI